MATFDKKTLATVAASIVAAAGVIFGISQCSSKQDERDDKATAEAAVLNASEQLNAAAAKLDSLLNVNRAQADTIDVQSDSIVVLNDSIVALNDKIAKQDSVIVQKSDSLALVKDQLVKCRNSKKKAAPKPAQPTQPAKPVVKEPAPVKPDTVYVVKVEPAKPCPETTIPGTVVRLESSKNGGDIQVTSKNEGATIITLTNSSENSGKIIVNNGGTVVTNTYAAAIDTLAQAQKVAAGYIKTKRVVRVK